MNNKVVVNEDIQEKPSDKIIPVVQVETSPAETLSDIVMPEQHNTDTEEFQHTQKHSQSSKVKLYPLT